MSRTIFIIAGLGLGLGVVFLGAAAMLSDGDLPLSGFLDGDGLSQNSISKDFAWDGGDSLEIETPATVRLVPGNVAHVAIRGPGNVVNRVQLHDGVLDLPGPNFFRHAGHLDVTISGITLRKFALDGSGKIFLGALDQDRLTVKVRGSGNVDGEGRVDRVSLQIAGSGRIDLNQLTAKKVDIKISGSGRVDVAATEQADVRISGSGTVRFPNTPKKLSTQISGSGRVLNGLDKDND